MFPLSIMNLQELLLHSSITMQLTATIRLVCLLCLSLLTLLVHVVFRVKHLNGVIMFSKNSTTSRLFLFCSLLRSVVGAFGEAEGRAAGFPGGGTAEAAGAAPEGPGPPGAETASLLSG